MKNSIQKCQNNVILAQTCTKQLGLKIKMIISHVAIWILYTEVQVLKSTVGYRGYQYSTMFHSLPYPEHMFKTKKLNKTIV